MNVTDITQEHVEIMQKIVRYAYTNPLNLDDMLDIMNGAKIPPIEDPNYACIIGEYQVAFTIENHPEAGWQRHLLIVGLDGRLPSEEDGHILIALTDLDGSNEMDVKLRLEDYGEIEALSVYEPIRPGTL